MALPGLPGFGARLHVQLLICDSENVLDGLGYPDVGLRRRLKVLHLMLRGELPRFVRTHLPLVLEVTLVANEYFLNVHICILVDALQPVLYILEGILIGQVENHYHSVALTVET